MTLIAGFFCSNGLLMCADMEESGGYSKRAINKMFFRDYGDASLVISGAGMSAAIDNAIKRMDDSFSRELSTKPITEHLVQDILDDTLNKVHSKYIWPNPQNGIQLLVGYSERPSVVQTQQRSPRQALWTTDDVVSAPEVRFACRGTGQELAEFLADKIWHAGRFEQQMVPIATFIFQEVQDHVPHVGLGTEMWSLRKDGSHKKYDKSEVGLIDKWLPDFDGAIEKFAQDLAGPTVLQLPFTIDVPYKEVCRKYKWGFESQAVPRAQKGGRLVFE